MTFWFFLLLAHYLCATVQQDGDRLCSYVLSLCKDSIPSILSLKPVICFASPVATFHRNDVRQVYGQPSLLRTIGSEVSPSLSETSPALPPPRAYWLKYRLAVPLLTCNLLLAAAEREPVDKSSLGLSVFYGHHVLTAKLCLSVPSALGLNVKQPSMEGGLCGEPCVFLVPTKWFNHEVFWAHQGRSIAAAWSQLKIVLNPMTMTCPVVYSCIPLTWYWTVWTICSIQVVHTFKKCFRLV